jgi:dUTP pyrophosphatase
MQIKIKKLNPNVKTPVYATDGAGCFDIHAFSCEKYNDNWYSSYINENESVIFGTGLFFEIPKGKAMLVFSRSGHGFKNNVRLANCVGVIDSDYRGELMVKLTNDNNENRLVVRKGDRIAQAMIVDADQVEFYVVDELTETERGTGGLGSTGVK